MAPTAHPELPAGDLVIIACGATKGDTTTLAADLYTGHAFRSNLAAARAITGGDDDRIRICSAKYGLVDLDEVIDPYECRMGDEDAVPVINLAADLAATGATGTLWVLGGNDYVAALDAAARLLGGPRVTPVYEGSDGIGHQRRMARLTYAA